MQNILSKYKSLKLLPMPELKLTQLQYETESLKRLLAFMQDENIHLKNRLSEFLKDNSNKNLLEEIEDFQSRFLKEDILFGLMRNEVAEIDSLLLRGVFEDGKTIKEIEKNLKKLRNNMITAEKQLNKLKVEFSSYLSENTLSA